MDHMEFSIALPPLVELTNAGVEWNTMKQRLYTHLNPTTTSSNHDHGCGLRRSFLINIAAEQVQGIFKMYNVSYEEASKFSSILQNIEDLCLPRFLIIYNRFRFFTCKQNGPEFNGFLQQLLAWSDLCEFGDLKDILLKDCIISGISEESVRQRLLRTEQLDFYKTVDICRAGLEKKQSLDDFTPSNKLYVNAATNTYAEDTQKFNIATNTYHSAVEEKGIQTSMNQCKQPIESDVFLSNIHEFKTLNLDGNHCSDQDPSDIHLPESFLNQESVSNQEAFTSQYIKHHMPLLPETKTHVLLPKPMAQENDFFHSFSTLEGTNHHLPQTLRRFSRNQQPTFVNDQELVQQRNEGRKDFLCSDNLATSASVAHSENSVANDKSTHLNSSPKNARLKCRACKMTFKDVQSLHKHRKTHEVEKKYCCNVCPARFFNASHLKVHKRLHTGERPYVCDVCGDAYMEASKLKAHNRKHTGERPYKCDVCQMTFAWSAAFRRHKRIHTGEKPYACEYCGSKFTDFTALQRHTRTHTKEKPYKCGVCGYSFGDPSALRAHTRIHTGERPYKCKFCGTSFTRAQHVKEHMKLHLGQKPFKCEICSACFVEASKLKSHMRRHTGEKPYQCKVCDASFAWTSAYTRHMRTHTFEKPYPCEVCGCSFADHSTMIRHHRIHTGERPYPCKLCDSRFADSSSLSRHQRVHSVEKAFTCEICGASFAMKSYLSRHIRIHTGEKPYCCDKCDSQFSDSSKLKRHQKIHERTKLMVQEQQQQQQQQQQQLHQQQQQQHQHQHQQLPPDNSNSQICPSLHLRHDLPHFPEDDIFNHFTKPSCSFEHLTKHDQPFDTIHGQDAEMANGISQFSFSHPHDESLDMTPSVSASLGMAPGMESFANILSFDP